MSKEREEISDHVSFVKVENPIALPHCVEADFGDGRSAHIRARVPLKPLGAAADVKLTSSEEVQVAEAMNLLLEILRELDHS